MTDAAMESDLVSAALQARSKAYAPYSDHPVGAAVLASDGQIYSGCNVENGAYPLGACAENGAIQAMIQGGSNRIAHIVIIGPGPHLCPPCGGCRQKIAEFADEATKISLLDAEGKIAVTYSMNDLLPHGFQLD